MTARQQVHASAVMIGGHVLLLAGQSGRGKSDLALRLVDRGALLVSDDYTDLAERDGVVIASAPPTIFGQIEIRGIGITDMPSIDEGPVALILDLDETPTRLPVEPLPTTRLCGIEIPTLAFLAFEPSAAIKAEQALIRLGLGRAE